METDKFSSLVKRVEHLEAVVFRNEAKQSKNTEQSVKIKKPDLDFSINVRAFINKFAKKKKWIKKIRSPFSFSCQR